MKINNLKTSFLTDKGMLTAVDNVSLCVNPGEVIGIVGESGCGKSVTASSIMRLFDEDSGTKVEGEIEFNNVDLLKIPEKDMEKIRGSEISMIFQDPMTSLNPVFKIGHQIMEAIMIHQKVKKKSAHEIAIEMLKKVGISDPDRRFNEYPHQMSGGMLQRIIIAMALSCKPKLLIADEPTTALDVTIQAQILDLMKELNEELKMGIILITHDLGVVAQICDKVNVMYLGQIVEELEVKDLFDNPKHPYTMGLLKSIPSLEGDRLKKLHVIEGNVPGLENITKGCRFSNRCDFATELCYNKLPDLELINKNHKIRCWNYQEIEQGISVNKGG